MVWRAYELGDSQGKYLGLTHSDSVNHEKNRIGEVKWGFAYDFLEF